MDACSRSLALLSLAWLAASPLGAQSARTRASARPSRSAQLDLATGVITTGPRPALRAATTVSEFPNLDIGGPVGIDSGGGVAEWFNDGVKGVRGNASDLMGSFVFAYASAKKDPALGGPGGSVRLAFYEGYTRGGNFSTGAPNGTAVAVFTLTGLPAHSASSSFFGGYTRYLLTVELPSLVAFADGPIGYSWRFIDLGSDGVLAGTFPQLACVGSCGVGPFPDALGQSPYGPCETVPADRYTPPGSYHVFCSFVPTFFPLSMALDIREAGDVSASSQPFTGDGINADVLTASTAVVGTPWSARVALGHTHGTGGAVVVRVHALPASGPRLISPFGGRPTQLLVAGPVLASLTTTHDGLASGQVSASIPMSPSLVGQLWAAQAIVEGGGFVDLSTGVFGIAGTR